APDGARLSRSLGVVEYHTLRDQFLRHRRLVPWQHRVFRLLPSSGPAFLEELFEELSLEAPGDDGEWTVSFAGKEWRCRGLDAVDRCVARAEHPIARDPQGHAYGVRITRHGRLGRKLGGLPLYVELMPTGG
ncbi:MAG: hypothetical protein HOQ07_13585, partial [Sinomonas sp.]|nr:hypothetical protein [Sinomonas sp.]